MNGANGSVLPLVALGWPLLLGALAAAPPFRRHALRLLVLAPLPALLLAFRLIAGPGTGAGSEEEPTLLPDLLLGITLGASQPAALLFGLTAGLWFFAAVHAQSSLAGTDRPASFSGFWCLTLAGNLGVFLAQDVGTFYVSFAAVSLSAYFLVVHDRTPAALGAGRVYVVLAIVGEVCLLLAFLIGAAAADSLLIADIRAALASAPQAGLAAALLIAGFGIKAGLMPLHVWLPLAHPAAPTPASAVLSGAIVKAGVIGLMVFLPPASDAGTILLLLGFATAFGGALAGLRVRSPKAILAYSTISQMGLVLALVAAGGMDGGNLNAAAYYAFHHGLAKGALFLGVAVVAAAGGRWRNAALLVAAMVALSVAGAPLTGGGLTKAAAKPGLGEGAALALTVSAATTTLVLGWFLVRLAASPASKGASARTAGGRPPLLLAGPTLVLGMAALVLPWWLWSGWSGLPDGYPLRLSTIGSALWPIALGFGAIAIMAAMRWPAGTQDQADPMRFVRPVADRLRPLGVVPIKLAALRGDVAGAVHAVGTTAVDRLAGAAEAGEKHLLRWRWSGLAIAGFVLIIAALVEVSPRP